MPLTDAQMPPGAVLVLRQLFGHLKSMDVSLTRLLELNQSPRENLFAAGSVPFGATVGTTPQSCTMAPPQGFGPGVILPAQPHRRGLALQNLSPAGGPNITIGLGIQTPQSGQGIVLMPGGSWDGRISGLTWTGYVSVVASAAGAIFSGLEVRGRNETRRRDGLNQPI